jgi:DNA-binding transcriptional MerR regulator
VSEYRDKETLTTFGKLAADEYLGQNKTPLNTTLKKIASQEGLTPHQIEIVASEANKAVWGKLFSMDKQASYDFPLADIKEILGDLQVKQSSGEVKTADLDYLSPPVSTKVAEFDPFKALGVVEENLEKSAAAKKEIKRQLQVRLEKCAQVKEELERELYVVNSKIDELEMSFVKTARNMILEYPFSDRGQAMDKIAEFLRGCGKPDQSQFLMKKLSHVMKRQGLIKEADLKAPEQYINADLPCRIVNGRHSLYLTVKTIMDQYDWRDTLHNRYEIVDSSLPTIKEKIREL